MIPARPDSGADMRQGNSAPGPKPDDEVNDENTNKENEREDDPMEDKGDKVTEIDL